MHANKHLSSIAIMKEKSILLNVGVNNRVTSSVISTSIFFSFFFILLVPLNVKATVTLLSQKVPEIITTRRLGDVSRRRRINNQTAFKINWIREIDIQPHVIDPITQLIESHLISKQIGIKAPQLCDPSNLMVNKSVTLSPDGLNVLIGAGVDHVCTGTYAYEQTCGRFDTGQPVSIFIGICPGFFTLTIEDRQNVLAHELVHGLGFDAESFQGYPANANGGIVWDTVFFHGKPKYAFRGTNAAQYVKEYFQCDSLSFVEFVDDSHVSHLGYHDQLMTDSYTTTFPGMKSIYKLKLTLKILEDSGWYDVDYTGILDGVWGKGMGCNFLTMDCDKFVKHSKNEDFFCFSNTASCLLIKYGNDVFPKFFTEPYIGGLTELGYCPIKKDYWKTSILTPLTNSANFGKLSLKIVIISILISLIHS